MCVIVHKPEGVNITTETLQTMWQENSDGAGIAYYNDEGKLTVEKGFMRLKHLKRALRQLGDRDIVIHFRWATHGKVVGSMTHPFVIDPDLERSQGTDASERQVLFHNGVIDGYGDKEISDTIDFVTRTLSRIPNTETRVEVLQLMKGRYVLMTAEFLYRIGEWDSYEGLFVSNKNWLPAVTPARSGAATQTTISTTTHPLDRNWNTAIDWSWEDDMYTDYGSDRAKVKNYQKSQYLYESYDDMYAQAEYEAYSAPSNSYTPSNSFQTVKGKDGRWYTMPVESE